MRTTSLHDVISRPGIRHLISPMLHAEVNACHGVREVSDAAAVTIASHYQSPRGPGAVLATLAGGQGVTRGDLIEAVSDTIAEHYAEADAQERRNLDMLGTWALNVEA